MGLTYQGRSAVVTGGAGALGSVIVRALLRTGIGVAVPVRPGGDAPSYEDLDQETRSRILVREADITDEAAVAGFIGDVRQVRGGVDYLVNAAGGYVGGKPLEATTIAEWDHMFSLNLRTVFLLCRGVLPGMRARGFGRIVSIAAMTAFSGGSGHAAYATAKRGVVSLTETLAAEVRGTGITVNAAAPGAIRTAANMTWMTENDLAQAVAPEQLATLVLYLCSDEAASVSGTTVRMPGGS